MLDIFRRKAQSKIIQGTVLIIAIVFIFWGVGGKTRTGSNEIALVNDETIPYQEYRRTLEQLTSTYRDQLGGSLSEEMIKTLNLKEQAVEQLVQTVLLRQGAAEIGLLTSKLEIKQTIEQMAAFQNNGSFDMDQYKAALATSRMTPPTFEASLRSDLPLRKQRKQSGICPVCCRRFQGEGSRHRGRTDRLLRKKQGKL